jgi:hypothetical protein
VPGVLTLLNPGLRGPLHPWQVYSETAEAAQCVAFGPDVVVLGPFGKHDALGPFSTHNNCVSYHATNHGLKLVCGRVL